MKIVILADPIDQQASGIHYFTKNLVKSLSELKDEHEYVFVKLKKENYDNVIFHGIGRTLNFLKDDPLRLFINLPKWICKLNPDVVVETAHFGPFNLPKHIKRITVIHDLTPIKFPDLHRFYSQLLQRIYLPGILKRADLIITNSQNTKNDIFRYSSQAKDKTEFIHLGRDELFRPDYDKSVITKYGIKEPYFLFVGTIEPRKNLITLLNAFENFKIRNKTKHKLVIVGGRGWKSTGFYKKLNKHVYKQDVIIPGYIPREELPVLYSMALAFIYPSLYEGFGFPVLEAMSCGTPVITSNASSLPEVGGKAALYFDPNSVDDLVEKMDLIYQDEALREDLKEKGFEQSSKFSWEKFAKEFVRIIEERFV